MSYDDEAASFSSSQQPPEDFGSDQEQAAPTMALSRPSLKRIRGDDDGEACDVLPPWRQRLEAWNAEATGCMLDRPDLFPPDDAFPTIDFLSATHWIVYVGGVPKLKIVLSVEAEYRHIAVQRVLLMYDTARLAPGALAAVVTAAASAAAAAASAAATAVATTAATGAAAVAVAPPPSLPVLSPGAASARAVAHALTAISELPPVATSPECTGDVARASLVTTWLRLLWLPSLADVRTEVLRAVPAAAVRSASVSLVAARDAVCVDDGGSDADAIIEAVRPLYECRAGGALFKLLGAVAYFWRGADTPSRHCFVCARQLAPLPSPLPLPPDPTGSGGAVDPLPLLLRTCRTDLCLYQQVQQPRFADVHTVLGAVGGERCLRMLAGMALAALQTTPGHVSKLLKPLPPDYIVASASASAAAPAGFAGDVDTRRLQDDLSMLLKVQPGVLAAMPNNGRIADMLRAASATPDGGGHDRLMRLAWWLLRVLPPTARAVMPAGPLLPAPPDAPVVPAAAEASQFAFTLSLQDPEARPHAAFERRAAALASAPHVRLRVFHGSRARNWLSILRTGLQALSGTEFMAVGAIYGPGVYTSTELSTAVSYASMGVVGGGGSEGRLVCVAECEALVPAAQAARFDTSPALDADGVRRVGDFCILRRADHVRVVALHLMA